MKKILLKGLSVVMSLALASACFINAGAVGKLGDIDGDGEVNSTDALIALNHSVGLVTLYPDDKEIADVNADGVVDSADALEILSFSVGKITEFSGAPLKMTDQEAFDLYRSAVKKARAERPSYVYAQNTEMKYVSVEIKGIGNSSLLEQAARETEQELMNNGTRKYTGMVKKGSENSVNCLPKECGISDAAKLGSVECSKTLEGNIKIDIKFKKEVNPGKDSVLVKALGVETYDQALKEIKESTEDEDLDGLKVNVSLKELSYDNCWITCVVNPETKEFVSLKWNVDMSTDSSMSVGFIKTTQKITESVNSSNSDFGY